MQSGCCLHFSCRSWGFGSYCLLGLHCVDQCCREIATGLITVSGLRLQLKYLACWLPHWEFNFLHASPVICYFFLFRQLKEAKTLAASLIPIIIAFSKKAIVTHEYSNSQQSFKNLCVHPSLWPIHQCLIQKQIPGRSVLTGRLSQRELSEVNSHLFQNIISLQGQVILGSAAFYLVVQGNNFSYSTFLHVSVFPYYPSIFES